MISKRNKAKNWLLNISRTCRLNRKMAKNAGYKNPQDLMFAFKNVIKKYGIINVDILKRNRKWFVVVKNGRAIQTIFPYEYKKEGPIIDWCYDRFSKHVNIYNWLTNLKEGCLLTPNLAKSLNYDQTQNLKDAIIIVSRRFNLDVTFEPNNKNLKRPSWIVIVKQ